MSNMDEIRANRLAAFITACDKPTEYQWAKIKQMADRYLEAFGPSKVEVTGSLVEWDLGDLISRSSTTKDDAS